MRKPESRSFRAEVRAAGGDAPRTLTGYPIVFGQLSQDLGGFRERIAPGACKFTEDLAADFNHDSNFILGRLRAGTLRVAEDETGIAMEVDPPDTAWARDLLVSIGRGDIDQGSFLFHVLPGGQEWTEENGELIRTLTDISVSRVSVVSNPAYTATSMQVRSMSEVLEDRSTKPEGLAPDEAPAAPHQFAALALRLDLAAREL